jgi:2-dehydropantoate 2-reductase
VPAESTWDTRRVRFVVFGAGAIGGVVGVQLYRAGHHATLVGRGRHLEVMQRGGLTLETPQERATVDIPAVGSIAAADVGADTAVLLTMKTQDTAPALEALRRFADPATPIVCIQNGVENERMALRLFHNVYGVSVMCPCVFLEPGVVQAFSAPTTGILDIGRYPEGEDDIAREIADALATATFVSQTRPDIMRWKYGKLIRNLRNAIEAACGPEARDGRIRELVTTEAEQVFTAAGIEYISEAEDRKRRGGVLTPGRINGAKRPGGSVWQSLAREAGSIETDYLSGHVALLGRLYDVPTPANSLLQALCADMAAGKRELRSVDQEMFWRMMAGR